MALLPWYKWYQSDWLTSETRFGMTLSERGLYRDLLDIHYSEGSIPADEKKLRAMIGAPKGFAKAWSRVKKFFQEHPTDSTRLINMKAVQVIEGRLDKGESSRTNGKLGGRPPKKDKKPTGFSLGSEKKPASRARASESESESKSDTHSTPNGVECGRSLTRTPHTLVFGEFGNAVVTEEEIHKLNERMGSEAARSYLERFDLWVAEDPTGKVAGGKRRKDRGAYRTVIRWYTDDEKNGRGKNEPDKLKGIREWLQMRGVTAEGHR